MKWDYAANTITLERRSDVNLIVGWVSDAQYACKLEFSPIEEDPGEMKAELRALIGKPIGFLELLKLVEGYDVWFTGHNKEGDRGRRFFLGTLVAAGLAPNGKPIANRTVEELLADDRDLDAETAAMLPGVARTATTTAAVAVTQ